MILSSSLNAIKNIAKNSIFIGASVAFLLLMTGCATGPNANPADPLEPFNRGVASFNEGVDNAVLKPVATAYRTVTPSPVRTGVSNVFGNLRDVWSTVNTALQLRPQATLENTMRVAVNTVFGLGGVLDIASEAGIERHSEDFGKTLGRWGVGAGPYVVLPLLGPSTLRDTAAFPVDNYGDLTSRIDHVPTRNATTVLNVVNTRANFLRLGALVDDVALDKYSFVRDAHLQRRAASIYGYRPPEEPAEKATDQAPEKK
jgi:phospholipid-binding lipoprotein MlaA